MTTIDSLCHTKWDCKYHIAFMPKGRRKAMFGKLRSRLREIFHQLAAPKERMIEEGKLCSDHIHMLIRIPPKYSVSQVVGCLKGTSEIVVASEFAGWDRNFMSQVFWARGYFVSTVWLCFTRIAPLPARYVPFVDTTQSP